MKEFDTFFLKEYPNIPLTKDDAIFALHIWIAALKWVQSISDCRDCEYLIQKELEDE